MNRKIKILAVSGSLRATSTNSLLVKEVQKWAPSNVEITIYQGLATLPAFDDQEPTEAVISWRQQLADADGILICSPEYAFGVPGTLKNAIEWTVRSGELVNKPLALITAASSGDKAHAAWLQIFSALSSDIPAGGALLIPFIRTKFNENGEVSDAATKEAILNTLQALIQTIDQKASAVDQ
ncbi:MULTISPECIES: NADPH-dependent FMN reductase [Niastella]|uniref:NAD(P)H-dependent oxidoreductase n=1 Tax=Niastella soli TaxID=2821487 RepID=A0ABS3YP15_9BACT|nr:NAD(P)H-dependent oxidoreductase [Niastella soli]MBO9199620.1 NAD(P)H-dependent oxidoreductase [Niastella soli]